MEVKLLTLSFNWRVFAITSVVIVLFYAAFPWIKRSSKSYTSVILPFNLQCSKVQSQNTETHHCPNNYSLHCLPACDLNSQQQMKPMIKNHLIHHIQRMVKFWLRLRPRSATVNTCRERQEYTLFQQFLHSDKTKDSFIKIIT